MTTQLRLGRLIAALGLLLVLAACAGAPVRHYFTLTYPPPKPRPEPRFPHTIRIKDLGISPTYAGNQLVFRRDVHEIEYYVERRWTERPQQMVSDLIRQHLRHAGLVQQVTERLGERAPDYVLEGEIEAIEELDSGDFSYAHLAVNLRLMRFRDETVVWRRSFDTRRKVPAQSGRAVVRAMSDILETEMNGVVDGLARHFEAVAAGATEGAAEAAPVEAVAVEAPKVANEPAVVGPEPGSPLAQHPQLLADDTPMPPGKGAIFLPALSHPEQEPAVSVYAGGKYVAAGRMGHRIPVEPGRYEVRFGSGTGNQQVSARVSVEEGRVTVVSPSWSALEVRVLDDRFIGFRGRYELISIPDREEFGVGFGVDEEQGELPRVWVLRPGLYKIIQAGGTYRDRVNFATVELAPGGLTRFNLVQDRETGDFKGAGVVPEDEEVALAGPWQMKAVVGGDVNLGRLDDEAGRGWNIAVSVFFDGMLRLSDDPHLFVNRLELEEGQFRASGAGRFEPLIDRAYLHSIYTFQLMPWFGPYARFGTETRLLPRYKSFTDPRNVEQYDVDGNPAGVLESTDLVRLSSSFSPLQLKQGVGGNFRLMRSRLLDLDLRVGIGARQYFAFGEQSYEVKDGVDRVRAVSDYRLEGFEGAVIGTARLSRWVLVSTEFDGLAPFGEGQNTVFTWRNQASLRLVSFASLDFRVNITRDPNRQADQTVILEQLLQLRFSYGLL